MDWRVRLCEPGPQGLKFLPYEHVAASSGKSAAEKLFGGPLSERGGNHQLRAIVRVQIAGKESVQHFFSVT
jgi:hypothetical protein